MSGGCAENSWDGSYCPQKRLPRWSQFPVLVQPCSRRNNVPLCLHCWSHLVIFIESGMVVGVRLMSDPGQQKPWMLCSQGASPGDKSLACRQHAIVTHSRRDQECQWGHKVAPRSPSLYFRSLSPCGLHLYLSSGTHPSSNTSMPWVLEPTIESFTTKMGLGISGIIV